jgi:3'(2'),5'-bisphosphate nucleotidase
MGLRLEHGPLSSQDGVPQSRYEMSLKPRLNTSPISFDPNAIAEIFAELALNAAVAVMRVYDTDSHARRKPDHSPVCDADEYAEAIILEGLASQLPQLPVLAEEAAAHGHKPPCGGSFILVDPVDGTREFLNHNGEFTINIALILGGIPCAGVVYAPALNRLWMAGEKAFSCDVAPGAPVPPMETRQAIHVRQPPAAGWTALASRSHADAETDAFLATLPISERRCAGSSLKFCCIAEGEADVYPRFGNTMEWDTAAGDAILRAAGGVVLDIGGQPLRYGKAKDQFKNGPFIAWGDPAIATSPKLLTTPVPAEQKLNH